MNKVVFIILIFLLIGCGKSLFKNDELSLEKMDYFGDELKISGYFYYKYPVDNTNHYAILFLYNNGVVLHALTIKEEYLETREEEFKTGEFYSDIKNTIYCWGVYRVDENIFKFEKWYTSSGGPLKTYVREGTILNDTTFHITKSYRNQKGEKTEVRPKDEIYHFKKFSPKPDSTNKYTD
ncbi:hypothetical protein [Brumimicrobium salinarum]|nr:hypothetical protein [Brumimicrobium salinarum]